MHTVSEENRGFTEQEKIKILECDFRIDFNNCEIIGGAKLDPRTILTNLKKSYKDRLSPENRNELVKSIIKEEAYEKHPDEKDDISFNVSELTIVAESITRLEVKYKFVKRELAKVPKNWFGNHDIAIDTENVRFKLWYQHLTTQYLNSEYFYKQEIQRCKKYIEKHLKTDPEYYNRKLLRILEWEYFIVTLRKTNAQAIHKSGVALGLLTRTQANPIAIPEVDYIPSVKRSSFTNRNIYNLDEILPELQLGKDVPYLKISKQKKISTPAKNDIKKPSIKEDDQNAERAISSDFNEVPDTFSSDAIEHWMQFYKENMSEKDFNFLKSSLISYFDKKEFIQRKVPITIIGDFTVKKFGWAMSQVYKSYTSNKFAEEYVNFFRKYFPDKFTDAEGDDTKKLYQRRAYTYFKKKYNDSDYVVK